jgi:hypothetical protein
MEMCQAAAPATSRGVNGTRQGCSKAKPGKLLKGIWEVLYISDMIYIYTYIYIIVIYIMVV